MGLLRQNENVLAYNLDHVGIAVRDLEAALEGYRSRYGIY